MRADLARWARYDEPFHFSVAPDPQTALRLTPARRIAEARAALTLALFRAAWADDEDINDPAVLEHVLQATDLPTSLLGRVSEPEVKEALRRNTAEAEASGVFGVPSFLVLPRPQGPPQLFFGQDRLPFVQAALYPIGALSACQRGRTPAHG